MADFDLGQIEVSAATGIDALFQREANLIEPPKRIRIASVKDLKGFDRISADTLVHKSERDLWSIQRDGGSYFIERLFDDNGSPLKG